MKLTSYPADYSSAYDDNYFCFEEVDVAAPTEMTFINEDSSTVGVKRYAPSEPLLASPRSLLQRLIAPTPYLSDKCGCLAPSNRVAAIAVAFNDGAESSPVVHFTASHTATPEGAVMGERVQSRTIAAGECDELAFRASQGDKLIVTCQFEGSVTPHIIYVGDVATEGINLFVVSCNSILSRSQTPTSVTAFKLTFTLAGESLAVLNYRVVSATKGATRLAWLNRDGYISYHTFRTPAEERVMTSRSECQTPSGTLTLGVESWRESTLRSGFIPAKEMEVLAGLVSSPRIWKITDGAFEPQTLLSHTTITGGSGAQTMEVTIRPSKTTSRR